MLVTWRVPVEDVRLLLLPEHDVGGLCLGNAVWQKISSNAEGGSL